MSIIIEPMTPDDVAAVMEIERVSFPSPWSTGLFLRELKLPFSRNRVARTINGQSRIVGYACWWIVGDEAHIHNLAVHPDHRRAGIARRLVEAVLEDAARAHARIVSLEVNRANDAARRLYERFGFTERGVRRNYYGRGDDAIIMTVDLI